MLFIKGLGNQFSVGRKYSKNIKSDFGIAPFTNFDIIVEPAYLLAVI
jgi:hypothetical protein